VRILITGSNSGFGKLATLTLARQGHHVIATMRSLDKSSALLAEAAAEDVDIETRQLDVCEPASIAGALADAADIDMLVNNAGFEVQGALEMIDDELMRRQLDTNVLGPLRMIRSVMPAWRERGHGVIVNVSSVVGGQRRRSAARMRRRSTHSRPCPKDFTGRRHQPVSACT